MTTVTSALRSLWSSFPSNPGHIYHTLNRKLSTIDQQQVFFISLIVIFFIWNTYHRVKLNNESNGNEGNEFTLAAPGFPRISPTGKGFQWDKTPPLKFRPFKPKYHLTMALETLDPSELIPMDNTYRERLLYRRSLLKKYHDVVVAVNNTHRAAPSTFGAEASGEEDESIEPRVQRAIAELYTWLMGTYLPGRYPSMFKLHRTTYESGSAVMLENRVMEELYPAEFHVDGGENKKKIGIATMSTINALEILLKNIDEDFLILLPEEVPSPTSSDSSSAARGSEGSRRRSEGETHSKYVLQAFSTCYPAGFNPVQKLGKQLAKIHEPVPGYAEKLEKSMDRFFEKLEVGKYVKRVNWSITTESELFAAFGGLHADAGTDNEKPIKPGELDLDSTFLRSERQTLHRLPHSKALVFAFHTYTYPIQEVKAEIDEARKAARLGSTKPTSSKGNLVQREADLATAIDGLKEGNVPGIHRYKRGPIWGEAVKAYLRS